jgi:hypothetical protein
MSGTQISVASLEFGLFIQIDVMLPYEAASQLRRSSRQYIRIHTFRRMVPSVGTMASTLKKRISARHSAAQREGGDGYGQREERVFAPDRTVRSSTSVPAWLV